MNHSTIYFDHENLVAYQRSLLLEELPAKLAVADQ